MSRTRLAAALVAAALLALVTGGAYALGYRVNLADGSVAPPSASAGPDAVVRTYVDAFNRRDAATMAAIYPGGDQFHRFRAMGTMRDLQITSSAPMSKSYRRGSPAERHRDAYAVQISTDYRGFDPDLAYEPGRNGWIYFLVRDADYQPWQIVSQGTG